MSSELVSEVVTVEKKIRVGGVPDMPSWIYGARTPIFAPERVLITWKDGLFHGAKVIGPRRLKSGETSATLVHDRWFTEHSEWPDWLRNLVDEYAPKEQP